MKKILAVLIAVMIICTAFAGCTAKSGSDADNPNAIPTEGAKINESDAITFFEEFYTAEELGLADVEEEYSLMVSSLGVEIDGEKYVKVAANVKTQSDVTTPEGKSTFQLKEIGAYFISFDGKKVLMENKETGEYVELENRYEEFASKSESATETEK